MKLVRLACAAGIILVSGGCAADAVTVPAPAPLSLTARLQDVLTGRASGVAMRQGAADGVRVTIRENWSRPQPEPLYVIDGVPTSHEGLVAARIDPARIADIRVMKTPDAVRVYGPRGKNGALLVTLKPAT
jgi:hypothetical protein